MRASSDAEVSLALGLFRRHGGVLSWPELDAHGVHRRTIDRLVRQGVVTRSGFSLYELAALGEPWERRVRRAVKSTGGWASHATAARWWGFDAMPETPLHVTVARAARGRRPGGGGRVIVHTTDGLSTGQVAEKDGIRVTTPLRTALDLATLPVSDETLSAFLGHLIANRHVRPGRIESFAAGQPTRTRGAVRLRKVARRLDGGRLESVFEARVLRLLVRAGLPRPRTQHEICREGRLLARADFAWPDAKVVLEADGFGFHATPEAFERDRRRNNELALEGWRVYHVTPARLREDQQGLADEMRQALRAGDRQQKSGNLTARSPGTRRSSALRATRTVASRVAA